MKNIGIFITWYNGYEIRYYPDDKILEILLDTDIVFSLEPTLISLAEADIIVNMCKKHIDKIEALKNSHRNKIDIANKIFANNLLNKVENGTS